jgi:hypothetical protein
MIEHDVSLRVSLISGKQNIVTDALSRWDNTAALKTLPGLIIDKFPLPGIPFSPPQVKLGAASK